MMIGEQLRVEGGMLRRHRSQQMEQEPSDLHPRKNSLLSLSRVIGNRAVQRLLAQRSGDGSFELDDDTADRIGRSRGAGQPLDGAIQARIGEAMGHDFNGVRVHADAESDALNHQLNARAFTTGQDVFFRQGDYDPESSDGQELITHELTHVVQQSSGALGSVGRMTVRPAGDAYEQEADAMASRLANASQEPLSTEGVQRQEEEEEVQLETLQRQEVPEEEEEVQTKALQRQEEEEEVQLETLQRQEEEEEEIQAQALQRQEVPEEEELAIQGEALQRQVPPDEEEEMHA